MFNMKKEVSISTVLVFIILVFSLILFFSSTSIVEAAPPVCGDNKCTGQETCSSCPQDCGACPSVCGDGTCDSDETCSSCSSDCGSCPGGGDTGGTITTTETTAGGGGPTPIKVVPENPKDGDTIKRGVLTILAKGFRGKHLDSDLKIIAESELFGIVELTDSFRDRYGRYVANAANVDIGKDVEKGEYAIVIKGDKSGAYDEERILINIDPTIYITTFLEKEEYFKGERIVFTGNMTYFDQEPVKNVTAELTISAENFFLNKTIKTDLEGKFSDSYLISFAEPDGTWDIRIYAVDEDGNEGSANLPTTVSTPEGVAFYTVTFFSPPRDVEFKRVSSVPITVEVREEGNLLENAIVDFRNPFWDLIILEEVRAGVYSGVYQISKSDPLGQWYVSVQALKTEDGVTKAGGNRIPITIRPAAMSLVLVKPAAIDFSTGQRINIEAELSYSNGISVENGNVLVQIANQTVELVERKPGIYNAHYLFTKKDANVQSLELTASDIYGNTITLPPKAISVEAISEYELKIRLFYYNVLLRYWYFILTGIIFLAIVTQPLWHWKRLKLSLKRTIENEKNTLEMQKDTQRKYFKHHSISREDYDKLMLRYQERASDLTEKRLRLQKRLERKKVKRK